MAFDAFFSFVSPSRSDSTFCEGQICKFKHWQCVRSISFALFRWDFWKLVLCHHKNGGEKKLQRIFFQPNLIDKGRMLNFQWHGRLLHRSEGCFRMQGSGINDFSMTKNIFLGLFRPSPNEVKWNLKSFCFAKGVFA